VTHEFHNFNVFFRDNPKYEVVAFTATQLPNISGRSYPPELAGELYPDGIPILDEDKLPEIVKKHKVSEVVLAYSDLLYDDVMTKASWALSLGVDFKLMGTKNTMIKSNKPVVAVCAVRTGAGKSTVTRRVLGILKENGLKGVAVRHPMPYGDLRKQICQKYESLEDLDRHKCTIEEREEYEPVIRAGYTLYAGVDYEKILKEAEAEADVVVWDGGNNDFSFYKPDLLIVVVDPLRPGDELKSYPGEVNARMADVFVVNKVNVADRKAIEIVKKNLRSVNSGASIIAAESLISIDKPELIKGKRVLVVEDGPTVTHGNLPFAAGYVAAEQYGAAEIVDPRPYAVGSLRSAFKKFTHMKNVLPSLGYGSEQIKELEKTINSVACDSVVLGTPSDLTNFMKINKPYAKVNYELNELTTPGLKEIMKQKIKV
jgi:predicted GTPase